MFAQMSYYFFSENKYFCLKLFSGLNKIIKDKLLLVFQVDTLILNLNKYSLLKVNFDV